ncbi:MAG: hypothetical protein RBT59_10110 [Arcobacteraceae bacterium]|jgi:hypothetical protein|nr:hypothetical protein [Arcobacteraceae bacterium]
MGKRNRKADTLDTKRVIEKIIDTFPTFIDKEGHFSRIEIAKQNSHPLVIKMNEETNPEIQKIIIDKITNDCKKTLHFFIKNYSSNLEQAFYKELIVEFGDIFGVENFCFLYLNQTKDILKKLIIASLSSTQIDNKTQEILTYIDSIESYEASSILVFHCEIAFENIDLLGTLSSAYVLERYLQIFLDSKM